MKNHTDNENMIIGFPKYDIFKANLDS